LAAARSLARTVATGLRFFSVVLRFLAWVISESSSRGDSSLRSIVI
jgi:hypothetical protein